jgi:serine/threonine-protein kinase
MRRTSCTASSGDDPCESPFETAKYGAGDCIAGKYRLDTPLGFGAMGMLWRAHNELLDAPVALKLIRQDARWPWSSTRLLREAKTMAAIRHPAIARVFDYGATALGDPFIAMELLQGEPLRDLLDRETSLSAVEAVRLLLPILSGMVAVHARGIVHRDLKPENVFLSHDDGGRLEPKLLDFGIAKSAGSTSSLTTGGVLLGSPSYMSPEQAKGDNEIDHRVDVWSAAVVLYEMIAGHVPWDGTNCPALLRAIVDDEARSIVGVGGVDAHLWSILSLGLAKNREDRWSSCRDFGWALAKWLASHSVVDDASGASLDNSWLLQGTSPISTQFMRGRIRRGAARRAKKKAAAILASTAFRRTATAVLLAGILAMATALLRFAVRPDGAAGLAATARLVSVQPAASVDVAEGVSDEPDVEPVEPHAAPSEKVSKVRPRSRETLEARSKPSSSAPPFPDLPPGSARAMNFGF